jgi:hypothetical protein
LQNMGVHETIHLIDRPVIRQIQTRKHPAAHRQQGVGPSGSRAAA